LLALAIFAAGCGGHHGTSTTATGSRSNTRLLNAHACPGIPGFTCEFLSVPLDHAGESDRMLRLQVGVQRPAQAPRGVLLFLTGGPGQPGVPLIPRIRSRVGAALDGYRLVMFDQRGTGAGALRCPALQAVAGSSDLVVPSSGLVGACAQAIGPDRRFFTTPETVADIEQLRAALGVRRLTIDGVSYGTYVAERYALTYPDHVARLVLDSVVPQQGVDPLSLASIQATAPALRSACAQERCRFDPARDLAAVVRTQHDGPQLLNALVAESIVAPSFPGILDALHAGAQGDMRGVQEFLAGVRAGEAAPADELSQGLHDSTLCLDMQAPWDPRSSEQQRAWLLVREARPLRAAAFFPYNRATALGNGIGKGCTQWPSTIPPALADGDSASALPPIPVLLLSGQRDLSTPLAWARQEAQNAPRGHLLVVRATGHSVQTRSRDPVMMRTLRQFLDNP
jgi:pimeloyl-ACP methyl ester carboxylesterase